MAARSSWSRTSGIRRPPDAGVPRRTARVHEPPLDPFLGAQRGEVQRDRDVATVPRRERRLGRRPVHGAQAHRPGRPDLAGRLGALRHADDVARAKDVQEEAAPVGRDRRGPQEPVFDHAHAGPACALGDRHPARPHDREGEGFEQLLHHRPPPGAGGYAGPPTPGLPRPPGLR